ncbi:glycosyltransferase family 2 protein [Silvibacterium acidisoli]|uniref:glycosyltransferase family 2 protein n=1 Tax=Acidobacteriaceae bacterium ZG23-2 TaxID=2883246 RepID=UPI00406D318C
MSNSLTVSVVIPTRNRPRLVVRAVSSALNQTYPWLNIVVVVDGPDEGTVAALHALGEERVKVVALKENVGGSQARNVGVEEATGDWIAFLDDDDEWLPQKIARQMDVVATLKDKRAIVACQFVERSGETARTYPLRSPEKGETIDSYMCHPRGLRSGGELLQTSTLIAPRALLLDVPFRRGLKRGQEFIWLVEAGTRGAATLHLVPETLSFFNADGFSDEVRISKKPNWQSFYGALQTIRHLFRPDAYAYCIATRVLTDAIACGESMKVKLSLLEDCLLSGGATPKCLVVYLYIWFMPDVTRRRIGKQLRALKRTLNPRARLPRETSVTLPG